MLSWIDSSWPFEDKHTPCWSVPKQHADPNLFSVCCFISSQPLSFLKGNKTSHCDSEGSTLVTKFLILKHLICCQSQRLISSGLSSCEVQIWKRDVKKWYRFLCFTFRLDPRFSRDFKSTVCQKHDCFLLRKDSDPVIANAWTCVSVSY